MRARVVIPVAMLLGAGGAALWLASSDPEWWAPPDPTSPRVRAAGEALERSVTSELTRVRQPSSAANDDSSEWELRLGEDEVNAWLATRLPEWLDHFGVGELPARVQVRVLESAIEIASDAGPVGRVTTVRVVPELRAGRLRLVESRVRVGELPVPLVQDALGEALDAIPADSFPAELDAIRALLEGDPLPAEFELGDGRRVALRHVEISDGTIVVRLGSLAPR